MATMRIVLVAALLTAGTATAAQAQGFGPGFHTSITFGGGCSGSFTTSTTAAPAASGPLTVDCVSGSATAAAEAGAFTMRARSVSGHVCCGTVSGANGRVRIQIEGVVITGPPAPSIPVSLNFRMRGTLAGSVPLGQAGVSLFVRLSGFNTLIQSTSLIDFSGSGILNQTGVFAPLSLGFPDAAIDQAFVTPVANAAPNVPLRLDFELMAYSDMAGLGATSSDFFTGQNGFALPFGTPVFNLPPGYTVSIPDLHVFNNFVGVPASISGDLYVVGTNASEISLGSVTDVSGSVGVSDNTAAINIDLPALTTVGGSVDVSGNAAATNIDVGELDTVGGSVDVTGNGPCTAVTLGNLLTVTGDLTLESCGTGAFSPGPVAAGGNTVIATTGYDSVAGNTATGTTTVGNATADARVTVELQAGSFVTPTSFLLSRIDPATLPPAPGLAAGGAAIVDPIAAYEITFGVPALNRDARLTFDVFLGGLDATTASALLAAVTGGTTTLVTRSVAGGAFQAFPVCAPTEAPSRDGCVAVQLLDAAGEPAEGIPAIVRFVGIVGHFSTWGVALIETSAPAFVFDGLLEPYPAPPLASTPTFRRGSVVPLKFGWTDAAGVPIDSAAAAAVVRIYPVSCSSQAPSSDPITPDDAGNSGGLRYDAEKRTWIFNWSTRPLSAGCFAIEVTTGNSAFAPPASTFPVALRAR